MDSGNVDIDSLRQNLAKYGQEHLLKFWDILNEVEREHLYKELSELDLDYTSRCCRECLRDLDETTHESIDDHLEPLPDSVFGSVVGTAAETLRLYEEEGLRQISAGKVAVLLLAGGQGTRLGVNYPKGMFSVGLPSQKTLYHLQAQRIIKIQELAANFTGHDTTPVVPWYIMTSEATSEPTEQYFADNHYFGLNKKNIKFFEQNTMPCVDMNGKILLETRCSIAKAPDGNGGLYRALSQSKVIDDIIARGIEYLHVYCVDNILVKMADPVFIGFCISKGACCGAKVVEKTVPTEPVGVICRLNGKYHVVEYSEISLKTAEKRDELTHKLVFNAGGIANHFFTVDFMKTLVREKEPELKHHVAKKKIPYCDDEGQLVRPAHINGIKMEKFVFDIFQFASTFAVWEVLREDEFSPLKNADGAAKDTPTTSRYDLLNLHHRWAIKAGAKFIREDGSVISDIPSSQSHINCYANGSHKEDCDDRPIVFEISPLVSYAGEGLQELANQHIQLPRVLSAPSEVQVTFT
jgi:UDP-N-acetylglucosamine/UDP-N-acetylgalactosamine diphosphorylase